MPFGARRDGRDGVVLGGEYVRGSRCFIDRRPAVRRGGGQSADRRVRVLRVLSSVKQTA